MAREGRRVRLLMALYREWAARVPSAAKRAAAARGGRPPCWSLAGADGGTMSIMDMMRCQRVMILPWRASRADALAWSDQAKRHPPPEGMTRRQERTTLKKL